MTVTDRDLGMSRILRDLTRTDAAEVYAGIRQEKGAQIHDDESEETIAGIATVNEFGSPERGIPERSFLRATIDLEQDRLQKTLATGMGEVFEGKRDIPGALALVGLHTVRAVQVRIARGIEPENALATIAAKGSSKPLIDTGRLRQSIEYEVRVKGSEQEVGTSEEAA